MRVVGVIVNILLRVTLIYFLGEVLLMPDDPRFAGKAIPLRNLLIVVSFSLLFPILHKFWPKRPWSAYPVWLDSLYLSLFWLDMAGNSFNLYDTYYYFDLIPHFHGPGAIAVVFKILFRTSITGALGLANIVHILLEAQEYYTDVLSGTHNVRGPGDIVNDLLAGVLGSTVYLIVAALLIEKRVSLKQ
jgi:hypothetical protein